MSLFGPPYNAKRYDAAVARVLPGSVNHRRACSANSAAVQPALTNAPRASRSVTVRIARRMVLKLMGGMCGDVGGVEFRSCIASV